MQVFILEITKGSEPALC